MDTNNLFQTEADRQTAIENMEGLKVSVYWVFLKEKIIEPIIKDCEENIFECEIVDQLKELKLKRKYLKMLADFPDKVIEELNELEPQDNPDPYETTSKKTKMTR